MIKSLLLALVAGCALPLAAMAGDTTVAHGNGYNFISRTPSGIGPGLSVDYLKSLRDDTPKAAGMGLTFGLPIPSLLRLDIGAKAMYLESAGYASAGMVGARLSVDLPASTEVFAQGYYAPAAAASGSVKSVSDSMIGVRWSPLPMVGVEAGYRIFEVKREDASRDRTLADGAYAGVSVAF